MVGLPDLPGGIRGTSFILWLFFCVRQLHSIPSAVRFLPSRNTQFNANRINSAGGNGAGATPKGSQETPGAMGKGLSVSSALTLLFSFLAYTLPILG